MHNDASTKSSDALKGGSIAPADIGFNIVAIGAVGVPACQDVALEGSNVDAINDDGTRKDLRGWLRTLPNTPAGCDLAKSRGSAKERSEKERQGVAKHLRRSTEISSEHSVQISFSASTGLTVNSIL